MSRGNGGTGNEGTRRSPIDTPGNAYKRNFNLNPKGRLNIRMARSKNSRAKSGRL